MLTLALLVTVGLVPDGDESPPPGLPEVAPAVETEPVRNTGDAADDPAIWVHPDSPARSTVIGTDKQGALAVYDLSGEEVHRYPDGDHNNVDVRYGFPLGERATDLVVSTDRSASALRVYAVDPATRGLADVAGLQISLPFEPYGLCLYASPQDERLFAFVTHVEDGVLQQWELYEEASGRIGGRHVRDLRLDGRTEGCVADDLRGLVYVAEETVGIWRFAADPDAESDEALLDRTRSNGGEHLVADVEGLALYQSTDGTEYLLASSQGNHTFVVYALDPFAHEATFTVDAVDDEGVRETDGIEVTSASLEAPFGSGLFVVQDGVTAHETQNFKLVPWERIAETFDLTVDTGWSPRASD